MPCFGESRNARVFPCGERANIYPGNRICSCMQDRMQWVCIPAPLVPRQMRLISLAVRFVLVAVGYFYTSGILRGQFVQDAVQTAPKQTPSGKHRLTQEMQLTGDQLWVETGVTV